MTVIKEGTKVRVLDVSNTDHCFKAGDVVTANGDNWGENSRGFWSGFEGTEGLLQYLLPEHFVVIEDEKVEGEVVAKDVPNKVTYAVFKKNGRIVYSGEDRDTAREVKAALGGKKKGVRIYLYTAQKEIR